MVLEVEKILNYVQARGHESWLIVYCIWCIIHCTKWMHHILSPSGNSRDEKALLMHRGGSGRGISYSDTQMMLCIAVKERSVCQGYTRRTSCMKHLSGPGLKHKMKTLQTKANVTRSAPELTGCLRLHGNEKPHTRSRLFLKSDLMAESV